VGFEILARFARRNGLAHGDVRFRGRFGGGRVAGQRVSLLLPETFMNRSGESVTEALGALGIDPTPDRLLVAFDDIDLPFARLRMRRTGGSGGHRGLADVIERLGTPDFGRLRFGVGRPPLHVSAVDHVLAPFDPEEQRRLPAALDAAAGALEDFVRLGIDMAMDRTNRLPSGAAEEPDAATEPQDDPPE
jgi:PTH1 family peptidyl-tRNA hydrolase